ncbi:hypothetical protein BGZ63DRAFT_377691 [Mariannaea sp. PMI_226]|nr:hypothetical protein BGZ63DRAFT_377691 [Mariannaea sp. PMI_226]
MHKRGPNHHLGLAIIDDPTAYIGIKSTKTIRSSLCDFHLFLFSIQKFLVQNHWLDSAPSKSPFAENEPAKAFSCFLEPIVINMPDNNHPNSNAKVPLATQFDLRGTTLASDALEDRAARRQILVELSYRLNPNPPPLPTQVPRDEQRVWWAHGDPPPVDLIPNANAQPRVHSSRPQLPASGRIPRPRDVRDAPSRQTQRRTAARTSRTIRALACEAVTVTLRNLLATQWVIERIEAISESRCNDITFNLMLRHYRPDFESLAACLFSSREKEMLRCVYWETVCPYEQEILSPANLKMFAAYLRNEPYLVRNMSHQNVVYLPDIENYQIEAKQACRKLLQFMHAPSTSHLLGSSSRLFDNWEYTPPGGWIEGDEDANTEACEEPEIYLRDTINDAIDNMIKRGSSLDTKPRRAPKKKSIKIEVDDHDPRLPNHGEGVATGEKLLTDSESEGEDEDEDDYLYMAAPAIKPKL